jgi:hypothetical protein
MANITDHYGENTINWGKSYTNSWWGSVNETNSWGIIYPANAEGSLFTADSTTVFADSSSIKADNGTDTQQGGAQVLTGTSLSDFTPTGNVLLNFGANHDHTYYTSGVSERGQVIFASSFGGQYDLLTISDAKSIAMWFADLTDMTIDTWYPLAQTYKVIETEADPDTVIYNQTSITEAQVKYIDSPVSAYDGVVLLKGGTNTTTIGINTSAQILTVGEAWNDRDVIKY